ncbi:hypothetical protein HYE11_03465 [Mycoplasmopsis bovis]|nr:hypothetical protein HYE11_03465 [Mycoplasmopsis bovis]
MVIKAKMIQCNVDKTTDAKNNNEKSEPTVTPKDQSDESRSKARQKW